MDKNEWPERFTQGIAGEIKRRRESRGWSFQQLADACTKLGYPTLRTTLANLENGRRKSITVHELIVIAEALDVPAVELMFPGLPEGEVEYLPGQSRHAWDALERFTGETWPLGDLLAAAPKSRGLALMRSLAAYRAEYRIDEAQRERNVNLARFMLKEMGYTVEGPAPRPESAPLPDLAEVWNFDE